MDVDEFHRSYVRNKKTGCWVWIRAVQKQGYGTLKWKGSQHQAHRVMWDLCYGLTEGYVLDHICRNRACVNPDHLREVSVRENSLENSESISALNALKERCPKCGNHYSYRKRGKAQKEGTRAGTLKRYCAHCTAEQRRQRRERTQVQEA
jgi:hypothetical protein